MSAQRQKPIDFATEGLRLAIPVECNCAIRAEFAGSVQARSDLTVAVYRRIG
jgi:hypothetical protein